MREREQAEKKGAWSEAEQQTLLDAMSTHPTPKSIARHVSKKTGRSERAVLARLQKIGFSHSSGQSFRTRQGFQR
jgi:hypothetical protein